MGRNWLKKVSVQLSGSASATVNGGGNTDLMIVFSVKFWTSQSPNACRIRIYNVNQSTKAAFQNKEFQKISLYAGFEEGAYGLIFQGDIRQSIWAHENNVDSYIDIFAADGQNAYQQGRINTTLAKGYSPMDVVNVAVAGMAPFGVSLGKVNVDLNSLKYPRGTPLAGMSREALRLMSLSAGALWSINYNKVDIIDPRKSVPGTAVKITAETGLVGYPRQTEAGIEFESLINPALQPHMNVELDPSQIIAAEQNNNPLAGKDAQTSNTLLDAQALSAGTYNIIAMDRYGDSRGGPFYDKCICIGQGGSVPSTPANAGYYIGSQ